VHIERHFLFLEFLGFSILLYMTYAQSQGKLSPQQEARVSYSLVLFASQYEPSVD